MKPPKSILEKSFRYRNSASTDVSKTWAEARKKLDALKNERAEKVTELKRMGVKK